MATTQDQPLLSMLPSDNRGWMVLELAAQPESGPTSIVKLTVLPPEGGQPKHLELVCQATKMRVYVNPDPVGVDEWEIPSESGQIFYVGSAGNDPEEA